MCKSHFKEHKRKTTPIPAPNALPTTPPDPEGSSVYDSILPSSVNFIPQSLTLEQKDRQKQQENDAKTKENSEIDVTTTKMPLVAHLAEGFFGGKPPAWHRNEERRARGLIPIHNPATQLEGWERELVWMEILMLTGVPEVSFRHLARAWGRDKGFHMVLAQFICERHGDVQRKKRKRDEEYKDAEEAIRDPVREPRKAVGLPMQARRRHPSPSIPAAAAAQHLGMSEEQFRAAMLTPETKEQVITMLRRRSSDNSNKQGQDPSDSNDPLTNLIENADAWEEAMYGDVNYNEELAVDLFNIDNEDAQRLRQMFSRAAADDDSSAAYSRSVASNSAASGKHVQPSQQQQHPFARLQNRNVNDCSNMISQHEIPNTVAVNQAPDTESDSLGPAFPQGAFPIEGGGQAQQQNAQQIHSGQVGYEQPHHDYQQPQVQQPQYKTQQEQYSHQADHSQPSPMVQHQHQQINVQQQRDVPAHTIQMQSAQQQQPPLSVHSGASFQGPYNSLGNLRNQGLHQRNHSIQDFQLHGLPQGMHSRQSSRQGFLVQGQQYVQSVAIDGQPIQQQRQHDQSMQPPLRLHEQVGNLRQYQPYEQQHHSSNQPPIQQIQSLQIPAEMHEYDHHQEHAQAEEDDHLDPENDTDRHDHGEEIVHEEHDDHQAQDNVPQNQQVRHQPQCHSMAGQPAFHAQAQNGVGQQQPVYYSHPGPPQEPVSLHPGAALQDRQSAQQPYSVYTENGPIATSNQYQHPPPEQFGNPSHDSQQQRQQVPPAQQYIQQATTQPSYHSPAAPQEEATQQDYSEYANDEGEALFELPYTNAANFDHTTNAVQQQQPQSIDQEVPSQHHHQQLAYHQDSSQQGDQVYQNPSQQPQSFQDSSQQGEQGYQASSQQPQSFHDSSQQGQQPYQDPSRQPQSFVDSPQQGQETYQGSSQHHQQIVYAQDMIHEQQQQQQGHHEQPLSRHHDFHSEQQPQIQEQQQEQDYAQPQDPNPIQYAQDQQQQRPNVDQLQYHDDDDGMQ